MKKKRGKGKKPTAKAKMKSRHHKTKLAARKPKATWPWKTWAALAAVVLVITGVYFSSQPAPAENAIGVQNVIFEDRGDVMGVSFDVLNTEQKEKRCSATTKVLVDGIEYSAFSEELGVIGPNSFIHVENDVQLPMGNSVIEVTARCN